jgi:tetratricopeptide (TPR) repeat protein
MAKIVQFPINSTPEKFGLQRVRKSQSNGEPPKPGQLNLFTGGKVRKLNQLSVFEEALLLDDQGDNAAAKLHYTKAIEQQDCVADAYCNLGIIESQDGNYTKAIDCFTQALKNNPRHYEAHYNLANLYAEVGNYKLAKIHYEIAVEIEPGFPNSYYNLGLTLAVMKLYGDSIKVLKTYRALTTEEEHQQTDNLIATLSNFL